MKILQLSIISALVLGFNAIVFGQYAAPQKINVSPGQSKTVKGIGRKNILKTYQIIVSSKTDISVSLKNITGQTAYALTSEGLGGDTESLEESGSDGSIVYKTSPLTTTYKGGLRDFFIEVKPKSATASFEIIVAARPITYKNYTVKTCKGAVPFRIGLFDGEQTGYVDEDYVYDESKPSALLATGSAVFGDLNGDGNNEVVFLSQCMYDYGQRKDFDTLHVFDLSSNSKVELTQLKDEELFRLNKIEREDFAWRTGELSIKNQILERKASQYEVTGGDSVQFTGQNKKNSFLLKNNRLVAADSLLTRPPASAKDVRTLNEYSFDSCGEQNPVILKAATFAGLKGKGIHKNGAKINAEGLVSLSVLDAMLGDLTGDGIDEGLAMISCNWGGTGDFNYLVAFNLDTSQPVKIAELDDQFNNEGFRTEKAAIQKQKLVVTYVYQPGKAYPLGERKTQAYTIKNGKFIRDTGRIGKAANNPRTESETTLTAAAAATPESLQNQTVEKAGAAFEVPAGWTTVMERDDAISLALPENVKKISNKSDVSFGIVAGSTAVKPNTAKSILNSLLKEPVINTKGLDDASKWFVKETARQFGYKQTGGFQKTTLDGKSAMQAQLEGVSKATGKPEKVLITTALMSSGKLFYLMATYPSDTQTTNTRVFEEIRNSVRLP